MAQIGKKKKKGTHKAEASHDMFSCLMNGPTVIHFELLSGPSHCPHMPTTWGCFEGCMQQCV